MHHVLNKGLNQACVHFSYQYIVKGLVILAAVYVDVAAADASSPKSGLGTSLASIFGQGEEPTGALHRCDRGC